VTAAKLSSSTFKRLIHVGFADIHRGAMRTTLLCIPPLADQTKSPRSPSGSRTSAVRTVAGSLVTGSPPVHCLEKAHAADVADNRVLLLQFSMPSRRYVPTTSQL